MYPLAGAILAGVYLAALVFAWRLDVPLAWLVFGAGLVLLPPFSGTFAADSRFGLLALPVYWGLARLGRSRAVDVSLRFVAVPLLAAGVASIPYWFP